MPRILGLLIGVLIMMALHALGIVKDERVTEPYKARFVDIPAKATLDGIYPGIELPKKINVSNPDAPVQPEYAYPEYSLAEEALNSDHVRGVFIYKKGLMLCGSAGCELTLYMGNKKDGYHPVQSWGTEEELWILPEDEGYYSIELHGRDGKVKWVWDGERYQLEKASSKMAEDVNS